MGDTLGFRRVREGLIIGIDKVWRGHTDDSMSSCVLLTMENYGNLAVHQMMQKSIHSHTHTCIHTHKNSERERERAMPEGNQWYKSACYNSRKANKQNEHSRTHLNNCFIYIPLLLLAFFNVLSAGCSQFEPTFSAYIIFIQIAKNWWERRNKA